MHPAMLTQLLLLSATAAVTRSFPGQILSYKADTHLRQESGVPGKAVTGEYRWLGPDGRENIVRYSADEKGYVARGNVVPGYDDALGEPQFQIETSSRSTPNNGTSDEEGDPLTMAESQLPNEVSNDIPVFVKYHVPGGFKPFPLLPRNDSQLFMSTESSGSESSTEPVDKIMTTTTGPLALNGMLGFKNYTAPGQPNITTTTTPKQEVSPPVTQLSFVSPKSEIPEDPLTTKPAVLSETTESSVMGRITTTLGPKTSTTPAPPIPTPSRQYNRPYDVTEPPTISVGTKNPKFSTEEPLTTVSISSNEMGLITEAPPEASNTTTTVPPTTTTSKQKGDLPLTTIPINLNNESLTTASSTVRDQNNTTTVPPNTTSSKQELISVSPKSTIPDKSTQKPVIRFYVTPYQKIQTTESPSVKGATTTTIVPPTITTSKQANESTSVTESFTVSSKTTVPENITEKPHTTSVTPHISTHTTESPSVKGATTTTTVPPIITTSKQANESTSVTESFTVSSKTTVPINITETPHTTSVTHNNTHTTESSSIEGETTSTAVPPTTTTPKQTTESFVTEAFAVSPKTTILDKRTDKPPTRFYVTPYTKIHTTESPSVKTNTTTTVVPPTTTTTTIVPPTITTSKQANESTSVTESFTVSSKTTVPENITEKPHTTSVTPHISTHTTESSSVKGATTTTTVQPIITTSKQANESTSVTESFTISSNTAVPENITETPHTMSVTHNNTHTTESSSNEGVTTSTAVPPTTATPKQTTESFVTEAFTVSPKTTILDKQTDKPPRRFYVTPYTNIHTTESPSVTTNTTTTVVPSTTTTAKQGNESTRATESSTISQEPVIPEQSTEIPQITSTSFENTHTSGSSSVKGETATTAAPPTTTTSKQKTESTIVTETFSISPKTTIPEQGTDKPHTTTVTSFENTHTTNPFSVKGNTTTTEVPPTTTSSKQDNESSFVTESSSVPPTTRMTEQDTEPPQTPKPVILEVKTLTNESSLVADETATTVVPLVKTIATTIGPLVKTITSMIETIATEGIPSTEMNHSVSTTTETIITLAKDESIEHKTRSPPLSSDNDFSDDNVTTETHPIMNDIVTEISSKDLSTEAPDTEPDTTEPAENSLYFQDERIKTTVPPLFTEVTKGTRLPTTTFSTTEAEAITTVLPVDDDNDEDFADDDYGNEEDDDGDFADDDYGNEEDDGEITEFPPILTLGNKVITEMPPVFMTTTPSHVKGDESRNVTSIIPLHTDVGNNADGKTTISPTSLITTTNAEEKVTTTEFPRTTTDVRKPEKITAGSLSPETTTIVPFAIKQEKDNSVDGMPGQDKTVNDTITTNAPNLDLTTKVDDPVGNNELTEKPINPSTVPSETRNVTEMPTTRPSSATPSYDEVVQGRPTENPYTKAPTKAPRKPEKEKAQPISPETIYAHFLLNQLFPTTRSPFIKDFDQPCYGPSLLCSRPHFHHPSQDSHPHFHRPPYYHGVPPTHHHPFKPFFEVYPGTPRPGEDRLTNGQVYTFFH